MIQSKGSQVGQLCPKRVIWFVPACMLSHVQLFVTSQTTAHQLLHPWDFPGKNTGAGCHLLLQGIFLTQVSNLCLFCLLHYKAGSLTTAPPGKPQLGDILASSWLRPGLLLSKYPPKGFPGG